MAERVKMSKLRNNIEVLSRANYLKEPEKLNVFELHDCLSRAVMADIAPVAQKSQKEHNEKRRAYYLSAEFLVGRAIYNNLFCTENFTEAKKILKDYSLDISFLEEIEDAALGNGGLGRLAACFLDSAANLSLPLDGYGIRYKFGLFKQYFENGFQKEVLDDWTSFGDAWSVRRESEKVKVQFTDAQVYAVPYDMPIIAYKKKHVSNLRLWQAEPIEQLDFSLFDNGEYDKAVLEKNRAEDISRVLYPNDNTEKGKLLRLKQQYFFSSASMQDILKNFKENHGEDFSKIPEYVTIQLNDTHPVISIPELIRLLLNEGVPFSEALEIAKKSFNYTNHTIMQEALEKWDLKLIKKVNTEIAQIIVDINKFFKEELRKLKVEKEKLPELLIVQKNRVHMAYLACFCSSYINGVAKIHSDILKQDVLKNWFEIYPQKFQNKTNGITPRRWLGVTNPPLSEFITSLLGSKRWVTDLKQLKKLEVYSEDTEVLEKFIAIKNANKKALAEYIYISDKKQISVDSIFDVQIKRLHEYKRQLLNALCILELYFEIKEGKLKDFTPTTFVFGAKSAPGYKRAKAIIKFINEIAKLIENDSEVSKYINVVFVSNYNVSYAEKIIAAADVSEQISTAGTEASGTGNMKLMLNGAVTLGTYDGANIEIVNEAGEENNYIFGARVEDIERLKETYDPKEFYNSDSRIKRCLDTLVDGTFSDGGTGDFKELYTSILEGASWHKPDNYYLLLDFEEFLNAKIKVNKDFKNSKEFAKKQWINMCNAGKFSSDRTIKEYAKEIWKI